MSEVMRSTTIQKESVEMGGDPRMEGSSVSLGIGANCEV